MVRNVKTLEGKQYSTRNIKKIIIDQEDSQSVICKNQILKQKNRQSAQRSRDNKKKFVINMELRMAELERQNDQLRQKLQQSEKMVKFLQSKLGTQQIHHVNMQQQIEGNCEQASDQTQSGKDSFQRMSTKSFISCGNFLLLAIIAVCCIFSILQPQAQTPFSRGFYRKQTIDNIMNQIKLSTQEKSQIKQISKLVKRFDSKNFDFKMSQLNLNNIKNSILEQQTNSSRNTE